jgi:hypothetical protein
VVGIRDWSKYVGISSNNADIVVTVAFAGLVFADQFPGS